MSSVVEMSPVKKGEQSWMLCGCTEEGAPFLVNAIRGDTPLIVCLVCPECETVLPVNAGFVQDPVE